MSDTDSDHNSDVDTSQPAHRWQAGRLPKLPNFKGESFPGATDQFAREVRRILKNYQLQDGAAVEWIIGALGGAARQEVIGRPDEEIASPKDVLKVLTTTFGDHRSIQVLLSNFHSCRQGRTEGIVEYAQRLQQLADRVNQTEAGSISPTAVRDRFVEGLAIPALRRDVRRFVRESTSEVSFLMARSEAQRWMREDRDVSDEDDVRVAKVEATGSQLSELMTKVDTLLRDKEARDKEMASLREENLRLRSRPVPPGRYSTPPGACFYCKRLGHKKAECRKRQRDMAQSQAQAGNE